MKSLTIHQLHEGYREKVFTIEEVIDKALAAAHEYQEYHCWIHLLEKAEIMRYAARIQSFSMREKPLWGIPFAIKDNIDLANVPTTAACPEFSYIPKHSAKVVEQLIEAGAIPIGKTNMDQFATGLVGTRSPHGATRNALNPELISGGSSSGSAVAVALGQVCFALGTDTAGSGRVPAALNNIIGYKAAPGRYSTKGVVPACQSLDCVSIFANTMADVDLIDQQLTSEKMGTSAKRSRPKILFLPDQLEFFGPYAKLYELSWKQTAAYLKEKEDVEILEMAELQKVARSLYEGPFVVERDVAIGGFAETHPASISEPLATILKQAKQTNYSAKEWIEAQHFCQHVEDTLKEKLSGNLLVLPTCTGTWRIDQVLADPIFTNSQMGLYTNHCNLLGLSAAALPAPIDSKLPFGITLFSTPEDEALLKSYAAELEKEHAKTELVVCGLHMRGFPLEKEFRLRGAAFAYEAATSADYRLYELDTEPRKPGLVRCEGQGERIEVEVWKIPNDQLSSFIQTIPYPLGIGTVELSNGEEKLGFVCQRFPADCKHEITSYRSWRNYQLGLKV
ncbi:allophanate hydrolase [Enterococcus florum]|uniref:Allophanate hydrolase n=1 Tax=Enterococcus florum TaxID=2480627 RepID=A0A4P5P4E0_9ENTE|nr:allophanate hydrolase [Enterococcus florum]GCF92667.1 allophanate hydrolase [Enterococcus florum]